MRALARSAGIAILLSAGIAQAQEEAAAPAEASKPDEPKFELGALAGVHVFADDLELGVNDDPGVPHLKTAPLVGARFSYNFIPQLGVEAEAVFISSKESADDSFALVIGWRANLVFTIGHFGKVRPFLMAGGGGLTLPADAGNIVKADTDLVFDAGAGLKVDITPRVAIRIDALYIPAPNTDDNGVSNDFEARAGVSFRFGGEKAPEVVVTPPPPTDTDGDGIVDDADRCIRDPEDKDQFEDDDGCPDLDNDADGVPDATDKCPTDKEDRNGIDDDDGCPDPDPDQDGILGSKDACPDQAEDKDNFQDEDGCPDLDNDADGVNDDKDKCPAEAETWNGFQDDDGCADQLPPAIVKFQGVIEGITFKKDSDVIQKNSFKILDRAVKVMTDYPSLKIEISGHTSDEGEHDYNVDLSKRRAESVKAYIAGKGIAAERINTIGYGPDKPIADNKTKKGKKLNRRIEFKVVVEGGAP